MGKISIRAIPHKFNNGSYLLLPATKADKTVLDTFCISTGNKYVTLTANYARANKSYDQVKTVFALINLRFKIQHHRPPTDTEQAYVYNYFLRKYADKVPNPINPDMLEPITLSKMTKAQAAAFIGSIIADIYEYAGNSLTDTQEIELKEIFQEFQDGICHGVGNPIDYDKDGNMLSEKEWREKNHYSFASGVVTEDLQLHHILTRNGHEAFRDCSWNWIMLTDEEHIKIIHAQGWKKFIDIFPHTAKRIKNAYDMAKELYPHELQVAFIEHGLIDDQSNDINKEEDIF